MDSQVLMPSPPIDFNFDSTSTSPYATAPSSPKILFSNLYYSAATSPTTSLYDVSPINPNTADDFQSRNLFVSCDENREQKNEDYLEDNTDFAFDFSGQLEQPSISDADELFHGGKIKPLEPPRQRLQSSNNQPRSSLFPGVHGKKCFEPFSDETPKDQTKNPFPRGREITRSGTKHRKSQSLSPLRVSDILPDDQKVSTNPSFPVNFMWYNKWNLKNLLLFRSTSEGSSARSDDLIKKYAMITKDEQDTKNSSFRSSDGGGSVGGSSRRRMKRKVSAHEIHYTVNRAAAEGRRKKTYLPYRSGLLGCLGFSQNIHEMSRRR